MCLGRGAPNPCRFRGALPPPSIVVFVNPHSRANRRRPELAARFAAIVGAAGRVITPASLDDLMAEAGRLAQEPPSVVGIHGGDGTLHQTIAALIRSFGAAALPPVAILTGGTMNVVASSLGIRAQPERLLVQLAEDLRAGRAPELVERRCLKIGDSFGFVFGNGFIANFLEEYYGRGSYGAMRASWILMRTFASGVVLGGYARRMFRRFEGRVWVEEQLLPWTSLTGVGAATVREVGMGFKLNHRADEDRDRFSVVAIHAGPVTLAADLLPVHRGQGIDPSRAWSTVASRLVIEPAPECAAYTIDGDLYRANGRLEIGLGPMLAFVRPRTPPGESERRGLLARSVARLGGGGYDGEPFR